MIQIPKKFVLLGQTITVHIEEIDKKNNYFGYFNDANLEIHLFETVKIDDEIVKVSREHIENTFLHELMHSIQFVSGNETDEIQASTYAGLLCEFFKTSEVKINPDIIYEPLTTINNG